MELISVPEIRRSESGRHLSTAEIYRRLRAGEIEHLKVGRRRIPTLEGWAKFLDAHRVPSKTT